MVREEIRKKQSKLVQLFQYENFKHFKKLQKIIRKNVLFMGGWWLVVLLCWVFLFCSSQELLNLQAELATLRKQSQ